MSKTAPAVEAAIPLALRAIRHPRSGLATVVAALTGQVSASVAAVYLVPSSDAVELLAAAGPGASRLGAGAMDEVTSGALRTIAHTTSPVAEPAPAGLPDPWHASPTVSRIAGLLPLGGGWVLLAAGDHPVPGATLEAAAAAIGVLVAALDAQQEIARLQQDLHHLRQDRSILAARLHHDLKTPLTAILGCAQTLRQLGDRVEDDDQEALLGGIAAQAERMSNMLTEALQHESTGPNAPLRLRRTEVAEIAKRAADAARFVRGGEVVVEVKAGAMVTDPERLERALLNLLDNALKYSPSDQPVCLLGDPQQNGFTVTVADGGPGVAPELVPSLFAPYATDPTRAGGTGLGLNSVAQLARELGGKISYSRHDEWTRFCLSIPDLLHVAPGSTDGGDAEMRDGRRAAPA